mgnify:CR=1 FL=1
MDEAIQGICERENQEYRDSLVRQVRMLERMVEISSRPENYIFIRPSQEKTSKRNNEKLKSKQIEERRKKVILYLDSNPGSTVKQIAQMLDLPTKATGMILRRMEERLYDEVAVDNKKIIRRYFLNPNYNISN